MVLVIECGALSLVFWGASEPPVERVWLESCVRHGQARSEGAGWLLAPAGPRQAGLEAKRAGALCQEQKLRSSPGVNMQLQGIASRKSREGSVCLW